MSIYKSYRDRVTVSGTSMQDAVHGTTKRQTINFIMDSPSLTYVKLNSGITDVPCIVSDKDSFNKREFLFLPDSIINVGDYIHYDTFTYLATDRNRNDIHPELTGELCNDTYKMTTGTIKTLVGNDDFGKPIYDFMAQTEDIPCVMTTKSYSTAENAPIPLSDGSMILKLPYLQGMYPKINDEFIHREIQYQVTDVLYENVIQEIGYVEVRLKTEVNTSGN